MTAGRNGLVRNLSFSLSLFGGWQFRICILINVCTKFCSFQRALRLLGRVLMETAVLNRRSKNIAVMQLRFFTKAHPFRRSLRKMLLSKMSTYYYKDLVHCSTMMVNTVPVIRLILFHYQIKISKRISFSLSCKIIK